MNINDPLRVSSEGIKHDYTAKLNGSLNKHTNKRYYPLDYKGVVNEWAAIVDSQAKDADTK